MVIPAVSLLCLFSLFLSVPAYSAVFNVTSGDVQGLIAAIKAANANGEENTINLEAGTYTLTAVDNRNIGLGPINRFDSNGLPAVASKLTLRGAGAEVTSIERDVRASSLFRIMLVTSLGTLSLDGLTIRGGKVDLASPAGGIANEGTVIITNSAINQNITGPAPGGGLFNEGGMTISKSTIAGNSSANGGGGIWNSGTMTISDSTIAQNFVAFGSGAGIENNSGSLVITNTTMAENFVGQLGGSGGGILNLGNSGTMTISDSTIARNTIGGFFADQRGGGILNGGGAVNLQNTIVALNTRGTDPNDCEGVLNSLGNNLIGDLTNCALILQPSDITGDPGLGAFIDSGAPGNGRVPVLETSQAIDRGNNDACASNPALATDQLGKPRSAAGTVDGPRICDIGAVEFFPVVNDLVQLRQRELATDFDPSPSPAAPAGTFVITANFENVSNQAIFFPFFEVVMLELQGTAEAPPELKCSIAPAEDQPVLLNRDGGPGRAECPQPPFDIRLLGNVGARMTPEDSLTTPFEPGTTRSFQFRIGLQKPEPFIFFVNMLGEPRTSTMIAK